MFLYLVQKFPIQSSYAAAHTHTNYMLVASVPVLFEDKELGGGVDKAVKMSAQYAAVVDKKRVGCLSEFSKGEKSMTLY